MYLIAKQLDHYGGYQLTFFRGLGTFVPALGYLLAKGISPVGNRPKLLSLRAVSGGVSLVLFFLAVPLVPITAAVAIRYLAPLFAVVFTIWSLNERVRRIQWLYFAIAFAGVVMLRGFDARIGGLGLGLILASAVLGGVTLSMIRAIGTTEHPMVIVTWFTGCVTLLGALGVVFVSDAWTTPLGSDWIFFIAIGLFGLVGQIFMTIAVQTSAASKVMPLKYLEAVFILIASYYFLDETYGPWALLGIGLIIFGIVANVSLKAQSE